jgi:hypothetical protein
VSEGIGRLVAAALLAPGPSDVMTRLPIATSLPSKVVFVER